MTNLLSLITPTNLNAEKAKFFASSNYHPVFHYIWQDEEITPQFSIQLKYPLWQAIRDQNHDTITSKASDLFKVSIEPSILQSARQIAQTIAPSSKGSASEIKSLFIQAFKQFNLDYDVEIVQEPGFNIRPLHAEKKISISHDIHFDYFSMDAEVHHELVHILRYRNGRSNNIARCQNFLPTEEGLASWCQDHTNDDNSYAQHAMEYLATSVGQTGSLRDIYNYLIDLGMSQELAWKRACRHKFGFVETKQAGDIMKPAMYFAYEQQIERLSTNERLRLFVGKIAIEDLPVYPTYQGIWPADQITTYFHP